MEDVTVSVLNGDFSVNPETLREEDITHLLKSIEYKTVTDFLTGAKKDLDEDEDADSDSASTSTEGSDGDDDYLPSILDMTSAAEIDAILSRGGNFREDALEEFEETSESTFRLTLDDLELIAEHPAVQRILARMRPEQITSELVHSLCRSSVKEPLDVVEEEEDESDADSESESDPDVKFGVPVREGLPLPHDGAAFGK